MNMEALEPDPVLTEAIRVVRTANKWREYENRKRAWQESHPNADPDDYRDAIVGIAQELGL